MEREEALKAEIIVRGETTIIPVGCKKQETCLDWEPLQGEKEELVKHQLSEEISTNTPTCNHTCNKKQVTSKLKNPCDSLLKADSEECKEQKSKLESEQMREYIPKGEVLDIIKSMPMDLVNEYVYELDGIWIDEEEVDYCNNCPYISYNNEDCISRQQAIEALDRIGSVDTEADREYARDIFNNLPPVTPTERTGEWATAYLDHESVGTRPRTLYCSECNWLTSFPSAWCPNCGAKMKGGTENE